MKGGRSDAAALRLNFSKYSSYGETRRPLSMTLRRATLQLRSPAILNDGDASHAALLRKRKAIESSQSFSVDGYGFEGEPFASQSRSCNVSRSSRSMSLKGKGKVAG